MTTVKISKIHNGRYGTKSVATIPKIAGGYGSVKEFALTFDRGFTYKNKPVTSSPSAPTVTSTPRRRPSSPTARKLVGDFVRSCTPKG